MLLIGIGVLSAWGISSVADDPGAPTLTASDTASVSGNGFLFAQLLLVSLGVVFASGEWASGAVRTSILAVDRRWHFLAGKATVLVVAAVLVTAVSGLITLVSAIPFFSDLPYEAFGNDAMYHLGMLCLVAAMIVLMGLGLGVLIRNSAGGIVIGIGLLIVLPIVLGIISNWSDVVGDIADYLPMNAAMTLTTPAPGPESIGHLSAFFTMVAWTVAILAPASARLSRGDV
ncbi:MAG: ABC transporter permease subunit [Kineosporiaceae bacterium]